MQLSRLVVAIALTCSLIGCHRQSSPWPALAARTGCTPDLLARTREYDSSYVRSLAGSYQLVQIDTTPGWIELEASYGTLEQWPQLRLWMVDSAHAHSRRNMFTKALVPANRPIAGSLSGYEREAFTADYPQVEVSSKALDYLVVRFTPKLVLDGPLWEFPIQRLGAWGFGGYFEEGSYVVPTRPDGTPLGQRAGLYCAFRQ
jgi:hypothetical protein